MSNDWTKPEKLFDSEISIALGGVESIKEKNGSQCFKHYGLGTVPHAFFGKQPQNSPLNGSTKTVAKNIYFLKDRIPSTVF